jgi:UDP-N-acetylmuramate--alanine ligase
VVADLALPGDLVVTLGAGDVTLIGPEVVGLLAERAALNAALIE